MAGAGGTQEYCLKWNNHRSTILSVMDSLLEEESLVDVTLSADGQILRAHRIILSACSPYFRNLFKSTYLNDKHPVVVMKDVDFENLKSLVEYMYKGEANVPQHMLSSFIQTAESLQVRGLAEGASKQKLEQVAELNQLTNHLNIPSIPITPPMSGGSFKPEAVTPTSGWSAGSGGKKGGNVDSLTGGILAARLAKMAVEPPPMQMFELAMRQHAAAAAGLVPPPMKKSRKTPTTSSPVKSESPSKATKHELSIKKDLLSKTSRMSPKSTNIMAPSAPNNNYESDSDVLKIDEDTEDLGKENKENATSAAGTVDMKDDDIAELDGSTENGADSEEEAAMTKQELAERAVEAVGFINPWNGEVLDNDDNEGVGPVFPSLDNSLGSLSRMDIEERSGGGGTGSADNSGTVARDPHTNKYSCSRCGRSYLHQATLVRHKRYECGISASYPCQLCGRKFKRRDVLKGHMEKCMNKSNLSTASSPLLAASSSPLQPSTPTSTSLLSSAASTLLSSSALLSSNSPLASSPSITSIAPFSGIMQ